MNYNFEEIVDLTHSLENGMPFYPGDPAPSFEYFRTIEENGVNVTKISMGSHTGTHIDAPKHFIQEGISVDQIPVEKLIGEAFVTDLSKIPIGQGISSSDLRSRIDGYVKKDDFVICYTGCSLRWLDESIRKNYTYLTEDAADYLVEKKVRAVGIDYLSVEKYGASDPSTHKKLLGRGVFIIESLNSQLKQFLGKRILIICLPLKLSGRDGAPARVLAIPIL